MSPHQSYNPPTHEFHPELGYLCPSRQIRQNVRVGLAAAGFGLVAGLAAAVALFPRHDASPPALTTPALAVAPFGTANDLAGPADQVSTAAPEKQPASTEPITHAAATAIEASAPVQVPIQAAPPVSADRAPAAGSRPEHSRTAVSKRTRRAKATARPRGRETYPTEAYAASPFSFETRRFSNDTRSTRRRDRGVGWFW
jgi:hypothetical protein